MDTIIRKGNIQNKIITKVLSLDTSALNVLDNTVCNIKPSERNFRKMKNPCAKPPNIVACKTKNDLKNTINQVDGANFLFELPEKMYNVVRMMLAHLELPNKINNISKKLNNNKIYVSLDGKHIEIITIPDGSYSAKTFSLSLYDEFKDLNNKLEHLINTNIINLIVKNVIEAIGDDEEDVVVALNNLIGEDAAAALRDGTIVDIIDQINLEEVIGDVITGLLAGESPGKVIGGVIEDVINERKITKIIENQYDDEIVNIVENVLGDREVVKKIVDEALGYRGPADIIQEITGGNLLGFVEDIVQNARTNVKINNIITKALKEDPSKAETEVDVVTATAIDVDTVEVKKIKFEYKNDKFVVTVPKGVQLSFGQNGCSSDYGFSASLGWMMGFRTENVPIVPLSEKVRVTAEAMPEMDLKYAYMVVNDFNRNNNNTYSTTVNRQSNILAKIPLRKNNDDIYEINETFCASFDEMVRYRDYFSGIDLEKLEIQFIDRFERIMDFGNSSVNCCLNFDCIYS